MRYKSCKRGYDIFSESRPLFRNLLCALIQVAMYVAVFVILLTLFWLVWQYRGFAAGTTIVQPDASQDIPTLLAERNPVVVTNVAGSRMWTSDSITESDAVG